jgi:hypothetical protein
MASGYQARRRLGAPGAALLPLDRYKNMRYLELHVGCENLNVAIKVLW